MIEIVGNLAVAGSLYASKMANKESHVCALELMLEVGYLDMGYDCEYRRKLYNQMYAYQFPDFLDCTDEENMCGHFDETICAIKEMQKRASTGESLRIWSDASPGGQCNLSFICNLLLKIENLGKVYIMEHPKIGSNGNQAFQYSGWGGLSSKEIVLYIDKQREMTVSELRYYSEVWERIVKENSNLRTLICGQIRSVSDNFYDEIILEYIETEPMRENEAIANFLKYVDYGVTYLLLAWRIDMMIEQGRIELVEENMDFQKHLARKIRKIG